MTTITRPTPGQVESRERPAAGDLEQRAAPSGAPTMDGPRLRGLVPYSVESRDLGGWREVIEPGALRNARMDDLIATVDHGGVPIGRHPGTLTVEDRADGLAWSLELPESRSDVREAVQRGDLCAGSWRMIVGRDEWRGNVRHIHEIAELRDVSVVSSPAYAASVVEHRSAPEPGTPPAGPTPGRPQRPTGGLRVEERTAEVGATAEARIVAAMAGVAQGEMRDLTHATADPVEPDDLRTQLIDKLRATSVVLASGATLITTDRKAVVSPILTGDLNPAPIFYDELDEIALSDLTLDGLEIPVKAIKALVRGSNEAFEDSDPDLLQIVADNLNLSLALKGDRALVTGSIATDPKGFNGLLNIPGTQSIAVNGPLSWDHVLKATGLLAESFVPGPLATIMGPRVATALAITKETTTSAAYLATPDGVPPTFGTSWLPVSAGATPRTTVLVYAPSQVTVVLRRDVTVEVDRSKGFTSDSTYVRGRYRLGLGLAHPQAVVKLTGVDAVPIA